MSSDTESNMEQQFMERGREGNPRRYVYASLAVLGLVAMLGTAMTVASRSHSLAVDADMVTHLIQESNAINSQVLSPQFYHGNHECTYPRRNHTHDPCDHG